MNYSAASCREFQAKEDIFMSKSIFLRIAIMSLAIFPLIVLGFACGGGDDDSGSSVTVNAPSEFACVTQTSTTITFSWKDNSDNETSFNLYVQVNGEWLVYASSIPAGATSFPLSINELRLNLSGLSSAYFCVAAYDGNDGVGSNLSNPAPVSW
jgi:hypothetical protein